MDGMPLIMRNRVGATSCLGPARLADTGWDFRDARPHPLGNLHPYPARFIPEIPRRLIAELRPADGLAVLDPFCGSGTTLTEAQATGLRSIGIDLNPIAVLMSRVKTSPIPVGIGKALSEAIQRAESEANPQVPDIPRLDHWFRKDIQLAVASLASAVAVAPAEAKDLLRLALSSIIVRVSNQDSDTRYAAVEKSVTRSDVFRLFLRSAQRILDALKGRPYPLAESTVLEGDILALRPGAIGQEKVGLVVTSPPYPNAYEYWLYHKYRMWWLGFDPLAVKAGEIGARAHFFGGNGHTAEAFRGQMTTLMTLLDAVLIPGGHACFVVGRSRIHGQIVDNGSLISEVASRFGFAEAFRTERVIAATRKSFNLSHANIKTETVLVLRKTP
ncbi:MAG: RNA methyltransferase [Alphaproteobacteria bacterium]|nr:RNA methyltransferase [Alphaproteobacteria bacterium]